MNRSIVWVESFSRRVCRRHGNGSVEVLTTLPEGHVPDGLKIASDGNLYVTGVTSGGIDVITPDGESVAFIRTGGEPLNLVFDGPHLYVTDFGEPSFERDNGLIQNGRLLTVEVEAEGQRLFRGTISSTTVFDPGVP